VETERRSAPLAITAALLGVLAVALVASTPASPFQPLVPEGYGPGPLGGLSRLVGLDRLSRDPLAGVGIVCMVLATAGFCWALVEAWRGRISLRTALLVGLALQALAVAVPLLFSRDVYSYAIYGRIWTVHGENPYLAVPSDFRTDPVYPLVGEQWQDTPAVYGPAFTLLSGALASFLDDPIPLITAFKVVIGVASVALLVMVAWLSRRVSPRRAAFAVLLLGWNPVVLFHTVAGGHNDVLVGLAIVGALALVYEGRNLAAAAPPAPPGRGGRPRGAPRGPPGPPGRRPRRAALRRGTRTA
jgi:alpha-1,6-mannosyltransferase